MYHRLNSCPSCPETCSASRFQPTNCIQFTCEHCNLHVCLFSLQHECMPSMLNGWIDRKWTSNLWWDINEERLNKGGVKKWRRLSSHSLSYPPLQMIAINLKYIPFGWVMVYYRGDAIHSNFDEWADIKCQYINLIKLSYSSISTPPVHMVVLFHTEKSHTYIQWKTWYWIMFLTMSY